MYINLIDLHCNIKMSKYFDERPVKDEQMQEFLKCK